MLFTSFPFLLLLALVFFLYYLPFLRPLQIEILIIGSFVFYAANNPALLALLVAVILVNAVFSHASLRAPSALAWRYAAAGVACNLGILLFFKYAGLLARSVESLGLGARAPDWILQIPLPIGISFFTFQGISLLVDTVRRRGETERAGGAVPVPPGLTWLRHLALYKAFFPQLIAGPIVKAGGFLPQISPKALRQVDWNAALGALITGYFLKLVVADNLKDQTFWMHAYGQFSPANLGAFLFGYSIQIYADFAGYSLIALGLAALFGYRFPVNFNRPYLSRSLTEFWTRWHISLSQWLKEYLYIPLGGNRKGRLRTYLNLFLVMFLGGLWHGASWNFALWGVFHGAGLALERLVEYPKRVARHIGLELAGMIVTFSLVSLLWLTFYFRDSQQVFGFLRALAAHAGAPPVKISHLVSIFLIASPVVLMHAWGWFEDRGHALPRRLQRLGLGLMLGGILLANGSSVDFIYFQF